MVVFNVARGDKLDSYRVIRDKVQRLEPFRGNTLSAYIDNAGVYRVFSYSTEIGRATPMDRELDTQKYSVTTSKHQSLVWSVWFPGRPFPKNRARAGAY